MSRTPPERWPVRSLVGPRSAGIWSLGGVVRRCAGPSCDAGGRMATGAAPGVLTGTVIVQGDDLGRWVLTQQRSWDELRGPQRWMLQHVLGIQPTAAEEVQQGADLGGEHRGRTAIPGAGRSLERSPRARGDHRGRRGGGIPGREAGIRLGAFISNQRSRAADLAPERAEQLTALGMKQHTPPRRQNRRVTSW
jgi:hypothetical protein